MTPHLVKWHERYASEGLTIIEVDNGVIDALTAVEQHVQDLKLPFVLLHDAGGAISESYGIQGYPTAYLIGRDGRVIWEGVPNGELAAAEASIRQALAAASSVP
jgi:peroxiredoxin